MTIDEILEDLRRGKMAVIMDDEDRENEGDLIMAADCVRPEDVNFMACYGRGLICLTLTRERCERLRLRIRAHAWEPITGALAVTTSIGVTTAPEGRATPSALLSLADRNLYVAKREGRDRVVADA